MHPLSISTGPVSAAASSSSSLRDDASPPTLATFVRQPQDDIFSATPPRRPYTGTAAMMGSERPYTAATMASARTSFTHVDLDTSQLPTIDGGVHSDEEHDGDEEGIREGDRGAEVPQTPQTSLTFLLVSGRRRQMTFEPETTVGRVKELVWNAWPADWQDERPPAPSYLRILYLGKILQDEDTLAKLQIPSYTPSPAYLPHPQSPASPVSSRLSSQLPPTTIVHLSIRPYSGPADDDLKKKKGKRLSMFSRQASSVAVNGPEENTAPGEEAGCCGCTIC